MKSFYVKNESRFAEVDEIRKITKTVDLSEEQVAFAGVPVMSDGQNVQVVDSDSHTFIDGITGTFKTRRYIIQMVISIIKKGESFIAHDCKGELLRFVRPLLEMLGYNVLIINLRQPQKSNCYWNPLKSANNNYRKGNKDKARNMVRELGINLFYELSRNTTDAFWPNSAATYFCGLAKLLMDRAGEKDATIENVYSCHVQSSQNGRGFNVLDRYFNDADRKRSDIYADLSAVLQAPNETKASIFSVFNQYISLYTSQEGLCDLMSDSSFEMSDISKEKTALFLLAPDESEHLNPLITAFLTQAYSELIDYADSECNGRLPGRVHFVLEELAQLPPIQSLPQMLSASRSRDIRFTLVVQSTSQLYQVYGSYIAHTIMSNCSVWIYLFSHHIEFLKELSEKCGTYTDYAGVTRPLLSVSDLQHFDRNRGEALLLLDRSYPFVIRMPDISAYRLDFSIDEPLRLTSRALLSRPVLNLWEILADEAQVDEDIFCSRSKKNLFSDWDSIMRSIGTESEEDE